MVRGIWNLGVIVGGNLRYRQLAIGSGLDIRDFLLQPADPTNSTSTIEYPNRPDEVLLTVPILAKYSFGPAGRAYVQGGVGFIVANVPGSYSDPHNLQTNVSLPAATLTLASKNSTDYRFAGGYSFGHLTARVSYLRRDVYFDHSLSSVIKRTVPATYFDFHQNQTSLGVVFTFF